MSKKAYYIMILILSFYNEIKAQELYPLSEPASSIPKNTIGVRFFSESYKEINQIRNQSCLRIMYGATSKLSVYFTAISSNHHGNKLPSEFPFHNTPERGAIYPYKFNGVNIYAKYRYLTIDNKNEHLRLAAYIEGSKVKTTHHEAEPNVNMGDNSGFSLGLINTYLFKKFASTLTIGLTLPQSYSGVSPDPIEGLPDIPELVKYGNSLDYRLAFGYLIYPNRYKDFGQTNINFYVELHGKYYQASNVMVFYKQPNEYWLDNVRYPEALKSGAYLDISPSIQAIIKSNLRLDFAVTLPLIGISYARLYPVFTLGVQKYFYL